MTLFDAILLVIFSGFIFYGFFFGLIRTIGAIAGVIAGAFLAGLFYIDAFELVRDLFFGFDNMGKVISFIIIFTIVNRLVGFGFVLLDKAFNIISIIPFLKSINRLAGAAFGFILGGLVLGLALYVVSRYSFIENWFGSVLVNSKLAPFLLQFADILTPLLPEIMRTLQAII